MSFGQKEDPMHNEISRFPEQSWIKVAEPCSRHARVCCPSGTPDKNRNADSPLQPEDECSRKKQRRADKGM